MRTAFWDGGPSWRRHRLRSTALAVLLTMLCAFTAHAQNAIVTENALTGNPKSEWDITGSGDSSIQGFATDISYNKGETARFKIKTTATAYQIRIYRLGYYQGNGARRVGTGTVTATLPQSQPNPLTNSTGLVDCGNWAESGNWPIPSTAVSGIYIAKLVRTDNGGASHIVFIVRDDASTSDLFFQTSDATWQAYNAYGGNSLYVGSTSYPAGHAAKVSYNRPFTVRAGGGGSGIAGQDWVFNAEYPMVRWLEANGYNVTYTTNVDTDRRGSLIRNHKVFLSVGHDEYWSAGMRTNVEAARDAGVHLAFFSGNEIYWKTRWENSISSGGAAYRTLVCYKEGTLGENVCGSKCDPNTAWTGLWRDGCSYPSGGACKPENALSGQISWDGVQGTLVVGSSYKNLRFWRNTSVASLSSGASVTMTNGTLGYEWDQQQYDDYYPNARILLSSTDLDGKTHHLSLYRAASGALVFGAGTVQWSWGLDSNHDLGSAAASTAMRQATVNLFADMGAQPGSIQSGLTPATQSTDNTPPVAVIGSPANGATVAPNSNVTISGTASDVGGTLVGVEVSVDGGATWRAASGTSNWTFAWTPTSTGTVNIRCRGFDDSGRLQTTAAPPTSSSISVNVSSSVPVTCPCTAFAPTDVPAVAAVSDGTPIEVGVKFRTTTSGYITGLRFYKGTANTGTHVGHLWTNGGTLLSEATFTGESASGWQQVTLPSPVAVTAGVTYVASLHSTGYYADTSPYFTSAVVRGPLRLLANGEDGANGLFDYSAGTKFPTSSWQSSNYWVDVVFNTTVGADNVPPVVTAVSPTSGASGVAVNAVVSATFNEPLASSSVTSTSFLLRNPSSATVAATVTYDAATQTARLTPSSPLANSTTYTATLEGGSTSPRITDAAGNALASDYTWSFTTTSPVVVTGPTQGPGGPILVINSTSNAFSTYPAEILRAEGLNLFSARDIGTVTADTLNRYDVVVLGETAVTSAQVTLLTNWVNAGGTLIALRPSKSLASLLGLTDATGTISNAYLKVNTASGPGVGIVGETIQFHGAADRYTLNGATAVATLYSNATTATAYPAVTRRAVGSNGGFAIAFTYDLAKSIVYTRQGNPAWSGQERDGTAPIRSDDLFYGASSSDPQANWVDLSKVHIPQADEQQRLFANLILQGNLHRKPLPRFWYFPKGEKAVVVMTGDDHGDAGMIPRFEKYRSQSPANCSVDDWECVRATGYLYVGSNFDNADAQLYNSLGFEVGVHVNTQCADWTPSSLAGFFDNQLDQFGNTFPGIPLPSTNRTHCIAWSDWSTQPELEAARGIRLDTNYYYWPPGWVSDKPGVFTGSGMPMRFTKTDGTMIDCYQVTTQMTDESGQTYPMTSDSLLNRALDARGFYGAFCANMHFDFDDHAGSNAIVQSALARSVPVVSAKQLLDWTDGRNGSYFRGTTWSGNALSFTIGVATGARNIQAMLPVASANGTLIGLTRNGSSVTRTNQTIKGIQYAFFNADPGSYVATYSGSGDTTPPSISAITATPAANSAVIAWTTNESSNTRVDYGTSSGSLGLNASNASMVTAHSISLTGLSAATTYYYRVTSADAAGNSATSPASPAAPLTFTTTGTANTAPVARAVGVPTTGVAPLLVNFSGATSTDANNDSLTFAWVFGDGGTATGRLASRTYTTAGNYAAILTVSDGKGGTDTASVAISVTAPAGSFPQTSVLDNFNRANGAVGSSWVDQTSRFSISSNVLAPTNGDYYIEWNGATFGANQEAFVTLSTVHTTGAEHNLMLKTQGTSWSGGHIQVTYEAPASRIVVWTFTPPSSWAQRGTINGVTFANGNQLGARALSNGTVQVYKNGALLGTVSISGWAYNASGGRIGISVARVPNARFDNFGGGTVPAALLAVDRDAFATAPLPTKLALASPYPNPTRAGIRLALDLPRDEMVKFSILDIAGREVWSMPPSVHGAGSWQLRWDGRSDLGPVPAGIYLARVKVGTQMFHHRFVMVR